MKGGVPKEMRTSKIIIVYNNFSVFSSTLLLGDHDNKNDLYDKEPEGNTICHDGRIQVWTQTYASSVWKNSSHY